MIKVNYDPKTTLVTGYYPDFINYTSIPEPYIEIPDEIHQAILARRMCVVDGILKEYVPTEEEKINNLRNSLVASRRNYLRTSNDYYAPHFPQEVLYKRALARKQIEDMGSCKTLSSLNKFESWQ